MSEKITRFCGENDNIILSLKNYEKSMHCDNLEPIELSN